jgi:uncharacterized membrane protein YfcA
MLEPQLKHNRYEFERLNDLQNDVVVGGVVMGIVLGALLFVLYPAPWFGWVAIPTVLALVAVIVVLEIRKALVFFRDVRERERSGSRDER